MGNRYTYPDNAPQPILTKKIDTLRLRSQTVHKESIGNKATAASTGENESKKVQKVQVIYAILRSYDELTFLKI